jgi:hypothetical protein
MVKATVENLSDLIDDIMHGACDMHVHFGPDVPPSPDSLSVARRLDALGTALDADQAGMGAIALKAHYWPTGALCQVVQKQVTQTKICGMAVINYHCGGFNPFYAEVAARIGCHIIMAPTIHTRESVENWKAGRRGRPFGITDDQPGLSLVDENGKMVKGMQEILDIAQAHNQLVASGHVNAPEDMVLVKEAGRRGLRTILTHLKPDAALIEHRKEMVRNGAIVEWGWNELWPLPNVYEIIDEAHLYGVENCCLTTDAGQAIKPPPSESMHEFVGRLIVGGRDRIGMDPDEVKVMAHRPNALVADFKMVVDEPVRSAGVAAAGA